MKRARASFSLALCAVVVSALPMLAQCHYRKDGKLTLQDAKCTPGAVRAVTVKQLCPHADTEAMRHVTESEKLAACREYGVPKSRCTGKFVEVDHLISLELGGSNSINNLWPEPQPEARKLKDRLEDQLHSEVCKGQMTLKAAQACISRDWAKCAIDQGIIGDK